MLQKQQKSSTYVFYLPTLIGVYIRYKPFNALHMVLNCDPQLEYGFDTNGNMLLATRSAVVLNKTNFIDNTEYRFHLERILVHYIHKHFSVVIERTI